MAAGLIEVRNLMLHYPGAAEPALRDISFSIAKGEIFGLLGPNGAGKTTTMTILSCLLAPTSGTATVAGYSVTRESRDVRRCIGLVPQKVALYPTLSAYDNLDFFGRLYGLHGQQLRARINEALEMIGLAERAKQAVGTFSGGMQRRLNIAAGLLHRPQVLILDEPTVGVDPQSRNFIFEGIEALNRGGVTVLYATHYMEEAERLCDRVAIIDQGSIVAVDRPQALVASHGGGEAARPSLETAFLTLTGRRLRD